MVQFASATKMSPRIATDLLLPLILLLVLVPAAFSQEADSETGRPEAPATDSQDTRAEDAQDAERVAVPILELSYGRTWIGNAYTEEPYAGHPDSEPVQGSETSPVIGYGGFALPFASQGLFGYRLALQFAWEEYLQTESGKVVPTQIETSGNLGPLAGTLLLILRNELALQFAVGPSVELAPYISPSLVFRIPVASVEGSSIGEIGSYFISQGRFLYPEFGLVTRFAVQPGLDAGFAVRSMWPLFALWDSETMPWWDQLWIGAELQLIVRW